VTQAINKIAANRGHITGVVLNKVDLTTIRTYGPNYSKYFTSVEKYYAPDKTSGALD
jgi:Mrp family chromosome partitioning ATPase